MTNQGVSSLSSSSSSSIPEGLPAPCERPSSEPLRCQAICKCVAECPAPREEPHCQLILPSAIDGGDNTIEDRRVQAYRRPSVQNNPVSPCILKQRASALSVDSHLDNATHRQNIHFPPMYIDAFTASEAAT